MTGTSATVPLAAPRNVFYVRARDAAGNLSASAGPIIINFTGTPSTSAPRPCRVTYTSQSQWPGGFVATVTIHNTGTTTISGWTLAFTFGGDQRVVNAWSVAYTQSGPALTARNADWNRDIPAGGSTSFGIQGAWTASNAPPTSFTLNGTLCTTG